MKIAYKVQEKKTQQSLINREKYQWLDLSIHAWFHLEPQTCKNYTLYGKKYVDTNLSIILFQNERF